MAVPYVEQLRCVRREIAMRERVYPRWVADRKMTQQKADFELTVMRAVADTIKPMAEAEELQL
jgi:hypothetical protein